MTQPWLPANEQRFFDSVVHGLRMAGWSRIDAESEAMDRLERQRQKRREPV
jgi:hypothetical protein